MTIRRRSVVVVLALLSLLLLTVYFRESPDGPLHRVQGHGSQVTKPFQVIADRIAQPFEDAYDWVHEMLQAKDDNEQLREDLNKARQDLAQLKNAQAEAAELESVLRYERSARFPRDYRAVNSEVMTPAFGPFEQSIVIAAGQNRDIRLNDPVINVDGLVGRVSLVGPTTARVQLVSDPSFAASARDLQTGAEGIVQHPSTGSQVLQLSGVGKDKKIKDGDTIITSGWRRPDLSSLYPHGITIGRIASYSQVDVNPEKEIQVDPAVDFSSLHTVIVLIPKNREAGGP